MAEGFRSQFVPRMKLHQKHSPRHERTHFRRYLVWLSFSLYLIFSFLLKPAKLHPPLLPFSVSPPSPPQVEEIKVYVYELPPEYNEEWLSNERCSRHLFAAEVAIHRALLGSHVRTWDPWKADFFFVPVYVSCNFSTLNGFPAIGHARPLLSSAVKLISSTLPFWNRSSGSDHVFVASHDFGACFHTMVIHTSFSCLFFSIFFIQTMLLLFEFIILLSLFEWEKENVAVADGVALFLRNSIILQTFGVESRHPCQEVEHVLIPPYIPPETIEEALTLPSADAKRDIWVFFRGKMELHPKNVSGHFYSRRVRTAIWEEYKRDRRFYLKRERFAGYKWEMARAVFCICPLGWAPWSPRLAESVLLGCIPVIIADDIRLPFSSVLRWPEISLRVPESDVAKLSAVLEHVASTNLTDIQSNLRRVEVRRALLFNEEIQEGDATWQVLHALATRAYRSTRKH